jgi:hypothetical protein
MICHLEAAQAIEKAIGSSLPKFDSSSVGISLISPVLAPSTVTCFQIIPKNIVSETSIGFKNIDKQYMLITKDT